MLDGEPAPPKRGTAPPLFGPCLSGQTVAHLNQSINLFRYTQKAYSSQNHNSKSIHIMCTCQICERTNRHTYIAILRTPTTCPHNMVNFGLLSAEIDPVVRGTPANFNGFRVLAALLHGTLVVGVSQTLRR